MASAKVEMLVDAKEDADDVRHAAMTLRGHLMALRGTSDGPEWDAAEAEVQTILEFASLLALNLSDMAAQEAGGS